MNLLDKYISEIGKRLPRKIRGDIEAEIRSTIEDMLEDRSQESDRPVDDQMIKDLLKEFGSPGKVAEAYNPTRYLIGPRLYPTFVLVLKIVFTVLVVLGLIGFGISFSSTTMTPQDFFATLGKHALESLGGLIAAFGNIVLIFAILERTLPASEFEDEQEKWDPAQLSVEPDPNQVSVWEAIFEVFFTSIGLIIFNFYPNVIGLHFTMNGEWTSVPALSDAFFRYLPWINAAGLLTIALSLYLIRVQIWKPITRWIRILIEMMGIGIAYAMLRGPSLLGLSAESLQALSIESQAAQTLVNIFSPLVPAILVVVIILQGLEVVKTFYRMYFQKFTPYPIELK